MEQDRSDVETLRRRLYRPDASPEDLDSYLDRTRTEEPPAPVVPRRRRTVAEAVHPGAGGPPREGVAAAAARPGRRRWPLLAAGAGTVVLAAAAVAVGALAAPPAPAVHAAPPAMGWTSPPRAPDDSMVAVTAVDQGSRVHATGDAVSASEGYLYTIDRGDTVLGLAGRFGLCTSDVLIALPYGADPARLPPGQRLLLVHGPTAGSAGATPGTC